MKHFFQNMTILTLYMGLGSWLIKQGIRTGLEGFYLGAGLWFALGGMGVGLLFSANEGWL